MILFSSSQTLSPVCSCPPGHSLQSQACDHSCDQRRVCSQPPVVVYLSEELRLSPGSLEALACLGWRQLLSVRHSAPNMPCAAAALGTSCVICLLVPDGCPLG